MSPKRGVIYVLTNPYFVRNVVKVGMTKRTASLRARELSSKTGVPDDFEVVHEQIVSDAVAVEREVHELLADYRLNKRREFFQLPVYKAVDIVQTVAAQYAVDEHRDSDGIDLLPSFEQRMRRWLRRDLVAVDFLQFSDLCVVKWVTQPDLASQDAIEHIFDLDVFGEPELEDVPPFDGKLFSPVRNSPEENAREVLDLDAYSMIMTGLELLSDEAADHVDQLVRQGIEPPMHLTWHVTGRTYDMWGENRYPQE